MTRSQSQKAGGEPIQLVVTAALKQEIPLAFFHSLGIAVCSIKALRSGAFNKTLLDSTTSVLIVITGVGLQASTEAANWIVETIQPKFVVNLGTAGRRDAKIPLQTWLSPVRVRETSGPWQILDPRIPFSWPCELERQIGGDLLSIETSTGQTKATSGIAAAVDMETAAQTRVIAAAGIPFSVLKFLSDDCNTNIEIERDFAKSLPLLRAQVESLFSFLKPQNYPPTISVVIPVHNRQRVLADCIQSVLNQTLQPLEIIVVDDGSTDATPEIIRSFGDSILSLRLPENVGVARARNLGTAKAQGEWIAFLDSDDLWKTEKLEQQWAYLQRHPYYRAVQTEEIWIRNGQRVNLRAHHAKPEGWIWKACLRLCLISPSSILLKRALFEELGGFDESLAVCEDYDLWLRLSRLHPVGLDPATNVIKSGGHADQLSKRFAAMDRFRVYALLKALRNERDPRYGSQLIDTAGQKLDVLIAGTRNRGLAEPEKRYVDLKKSLATEAPGPDELQWLIET